jgi:hypothetical protein
MGTTTLDQACRFSGATPLAPGDTFTYNNGLTSFDSAGWDNTSSRRLPTPAMIVMEAEQLTIGANDRLDGVRFIVGKKSGTARAGNVVVTGGGDAVLCAAGVNCTGAHMGYTTPSTAGCTNEVAGPVATFLSGSGGAAGSKFAIFARGTCDIAGDAVVFGSVSCGNVLLRADDTCIVGHVHGWSKSGSPAYAYPAACNSGFAASCAAPSVCIEGSVGLFGDLYAAHDLSVPGGLFLPTDFNGKVAAVRAENNICIDGPSRVMAQIASEAPAATGVIKLGTDVFVGMNGESGYGWATDRAAWMDNGW